MRATSFHLEQIALLREQGESLRDMSSELRATARLLQAESRRVQDHACATRTISRRLARHKLPA